MLTVRWGNVGLCTYFLLLTFRSVSISYGFYVRIKNVVFLSKYNYFCFKLPILGIYGKVGRVIKINISF